MDTVAGHVRREGCTDGRLHHSSVKNTTENLSACHNSRLATDERRVPCSEARALDHEIQVTPLFGISISWSVPAARHATYGRSAKFELAFQPKAKFWSKTSVRRPRSGMQTTGIHLVHFQKLYADKYKASRKLGFTRRRRQQRSFVQERTMLAPTWLLSLDPPPHPSSPNQTVQPGSAAGFF